MQQEILYQFPYISGKFLCVKKKAEIKNVEIYPQFNVCHIYSFSVILENSDKDGISW